LLLFEKLILPLLPYVLRFAARYCSRIATGVHFTTASYGMPNPGVKGKLHENIDY